MALNVAWRWSTPQIGDPSTVAKQNQQGFQNFAEGLGQMIGGIRQENREDEQRRQAQENWERTFDQNKLQNTLQQQNWLRQFAQNRYQAEQQQKNWQAQYDLQRAAQEFNQGRTQEQDAYMNQLYMDTLVNNPDMRMAAMLAMAGQPGALIQALSAKQSQPEAVQKEMDALEEAIASSLYELEEKSPNIFNKTVEYLAPMYKSKFEELTAKGAKSRKGETWADAWEALLTEKKRKKAAKAAEDAADEAYVKGMSAK